jgi:hypothetical protein
LVVAASTDQAEANHKESVATVTSENIFRSLVIFIWVERNCRPKSSRGNSGTFFVKPTRI